MFFLNYRFVWVRRGLFFYTLLVLTSFFYLSGAEAAVHVFDGKCGSCHLNTPEKGGKLLFSKDVSTLCLSCHDQLRRQSHPVGVVPVITLPAGFPLNWKGELTCVTCHVAHGKDEGEGNFFLLRTPDRGEAFCRKCHRDFVNLLSLHRGESDSAHLGKRYRRQSSDGEIDTLSIKCLNCHDGTTATDNMINYQGRGSYSHMPGGGVSHPIGVLYKETGGYVKISELDERVKLFGGRVGCGSCHSPYSKERFKLVITGNYSRLCFACHRK